MKIPAIKDWQKVPKVLRGEWPLEEPEYRVETSALRCSTWFDHALRDAPYVAIDTEYVTESGFLLTVGMGYVGHEYVLQFDAKSAHWSDKKGFGELLTELVKVKPVVFQNAVADIPILEQAFGIEYGDYLHIDDTMLAHAVLWSDWPHDLGFLASIYGQHQKMKHLDRNNPLYNVGDVVDTISVWEGLKDELEADSESNQIYFTQSLPVIPIILRAMAKGLRVNQGRVRGVYRELQAHRQWAQDIAQAYAGYPLNVGSDKQLKYYLYEHEALPVQCVPRSKKPTVDGDAIASLRRLVGTVPDVEAEAKFGVSPDTACEHLRGEANPVLEARVVYAAAQQTLSHYIKPLTDAERVHPRFLIHAQASGRWSTTEPPMAQLPKQYNNIVIPDEDEKWVEWDWDQIELRILAALSHDEVYEEGFKQGWDIHTLNTCDVFGFQYPQDRTNPHGSTVDAIWREAIRWGGKDDPRRRFAKVFIFRLNYGGEAKTATDIPGVAQLGLKARDLVRGSQLYLGRHPRIRQYWQTLSDSALRQGESRTFLGRRRRLLADSIPANRRVAYNHPMQGGVSDIFNTTLIRVANECPEAIFKYGVHDAQKWGVPTEKYEELKERMHEIVHRPWRVDGRDVIFPATFKP